MKRLTKNAAAIVGSDLTRKLFGFLSVAYLTRHITVSDFGVVNLGMTILSYVLMISAAGLPALGAREIARTSSPGIIGRIVITRLTLTVLTVAMTILLTMAFVTNTLVATMIILITFSAIPNSLFLDWYFQGKETMALIGAARGFSAMTNFLIIMFFVKSSQELLWVAIAAIVSDMIACIVYLYFLKKEPFPLTLRVTIENMVSVLKQSMPLGIGSILAHISLNAAPIIIGIALTTHSVGIFSAAFKFVFFLMIFDRVLATLLLPASSRMFKQSEENFLNQIREAQKWVFVLALPICAGGSLLSSHLILFVFGSQYTESAIVLTILIWFLFLTMLQTIYSSALFAVDRERDYAKVMVISAVCYFVFVTVGSLLFGATGAAVGIITAEVIAVLLTRMKLVELFPVRFPDSILKIILAITIMVIGLLLLPPLHVILSIAIGAIIYSATVMLIRGVRIEELQTLLRRVL